MKPFKSVLLILLLLGGCAVSDVYETQPLQADARWALLPMVNYAEAPMAGQRAESILATLLRKQGINSLETYPQRDDEGLPELNDERRLSHAMEWARNSDFQYGVRGSVKEWQYKSGLDGEPAVGLTVEVIEIASGRVVWSASGAESGWGFDTLAGTAQELLVDLIATLPLQ
ncbi:PBP1b-binding outer membrane lipoprotein LpoB [Methylohalomonas lacus]|uniref:PBP1b-binding outer membrane lipoprotein LpoB n=1 Tax=Methylohalomonas lacus TaxID=398773 RepID=A0AAE3L131_9GAMM|nr:hypothetical protein [Methylohalomonas lacus]MCS3903010.1 PBP1b-binding outer membrane lipoprotein LpoB [Methylohalomonas lacus]